MNKLFKEAISEMKYEKRGLKQYLYESTFEGNGESNLKKFDNSHMINYLSKYVDNNHDLNHEMEEVRGNAYRSYHTDSYNKKDVAQAFEEIIRKAVDKYSRESSKDIYKDSYLQAYGEEIDDEYLTPEEITEVLEKVIKTLSGNYESTFKQAMDDTPTGDLEHYAFKSQEPED